MTAESTTTITCSNCGAVLKAKAEWAGKRAKCSKCGEAIEIPAPEKPKAQDNIPLATERQKEFARSLDIQFSDKINRRDISKLIDSAVKKDDGERYKRLDDLGDRESQAWGEMRKEVIAEIDAEDCRISRATPSQIVEALSDRGLAAILITMPLDDIVDFDDLTGVKAELSFSDEMTQDDMESALLVFAGHIMNRRAQ